MKNLKKITIFNLVIFGIIGVLGTIMLFRVSYARYLSNNDNTDYWDGSSVSSTLSGSGTSSSPYLISNGADLKLFINRCNSSSYYRSKYYKLTADIYLNEGYFDYEDENNPKYYKDNQEYLISGDKYYNSVQDILNNNPVGTINQLPRTDFTFTGNFNGNGKTINGLFYYSNTYYDEYGFFKIIQDATVQNVRFLNTYISGCASYLGVVGYSYTSTATGNTVKDIVFSGFIKNQNVYDTRNGSASSPSQNVINVSGGNNPVYAEEPYYKYVVSGTASASFKYGGNTYSSGAFSIELSNHVSTITVTPVSSNVTFTNLSYKEYSHEDKTGFIGCFSNCGTFENIVVRGKIVGDNSVGGVFGKAIIGGILGNTCPDSRVCVIRRIYNLATIISTDNAGGLVGSLITHCSLNEFTLSYNYAEIRCPRYSGGLFGFIKQDANRLYISKCFDLQKNTSAFSGRIAGYVKLLSSYTFSQFFNGTKIYYTSGSGNPIGNISNSNASSAGISSVSYSTLTSQTHIQSTMGFDKYGSGGTIQNGYVWVYRSSLPPVIYYDDYTVPTVTVTVGSNSWTGLNSISRVRLTSDTAVIINANDNKDLAKIEYYIRDGFSNSYSGYNTFQYSFYDGSNINIELNDCKTIFVKATDVYGNVTYANSDLIVYDGYETSFTEGINDYPIDDYNGRQVTKDSVLNLNCTHQMTVSNYSSWYSTAARTNLYIYEEPLPIDTKIVLYDDFYDQTYMYTVNSTPTANTNSDDDTYYVYNLANFRSIVNNTAYDNKVSSHHSNGVLNENYKISFDFSDVDDDDFPIYIEPELVAVASGVSEYEGASYFAYSVYNSFSHISYNLDVSEEDDGDSISLVGPDNYAHFYFDVVFEKTAKSYGPSGNVMQKYGPDIGNNDYILKVELLGPNNENLSQLFHGNFELFYDNNNGYEDDYSFNSNNKVNIVYKPYFYNYGSQYRANDSIELYQHIRSYFIDCLNGDYNLVFKVCNYAGTVLATDTVTVTNNYCNGINGIGFSTSIADGDRIINGSTGKTSLNNSRIRLNYKYRGSFSSKKISMSVSKYTSQTATQNVAPSQLFTNSFTNISGNYYSFKTITGSQNVNYYTDLNLKSNISPGSYNIKFFLETNSGRLAEENYNIIVK